MKTNIELEKCIGCGAYSIECTEQAIIMLLGFLFRQKFQQFLVGIFGNLFMAVEPYPV